MVVVKVAQLVVLVVVVITIMVLVVQVQLIKVLQVVLVLAVLFNLPGNALIGGGGGIAMMAGMSRLYSFPAYLLLIAVAILPGPILVMLSKLIQ